MFGVGPHKISSQQYLLLTLLFVFFDLVFYILSVVAVDCKKVIGSYCSKFLTINCVIIIF